MAAVPRMREMFDTDSPSEMTERFESFKSELNKSCQRPLPAPGNGQSQPAPTAAEQFQAGLSDPSITKALSAEVLASVQTQLAAADIGKDITTTGPFGGGGLVAYDLEQPAKLLAPRPTPLRNRITRRQGMGTAHMFKRITGYSGTQTGGVGLLRPGISESTYTQFNSPGGANYLRGPKITYAGDTVTVPYKTFGVSDSVTWDADMSSRGYEDLRQLSQTSVLYASMLAEERMILGGRSSDGGSSGAVPAPAVGALSVVATPTGEVGNTASIPTLYVWVTATSMWGESAPTQLQTTGLSGAVASGTPPGSVVRLTIPQTSGALGYRIYVGANNTATGGIYTGMFLASVVGQGNGIVTVTDSGTTVANSQPFAGSVGAGVYDIQFTGGGTGGAPSSGTNPLPNALTDSTASAGDYDGILSYCLGPQAGYVKNIGGTFSTSNPGNEFNTAFASLYDSVKADPDEILLNGIDRKQLSDALKAGGNTSGYRIMVDNGMGSGDGIHNATIGSLVSSVQNEVTGKMLGVTVHPWLPQGVAPIISWTLPLPDSNVSEVFSIFNVQDMMSIQWPQIQFSYDVSSYWRSALVCYAPAWLGAITGISRI